MSKDGKYIHRRFSPLAYVLAVTMGVAVGMFSFLTIISVGDDISFYTDLIGVSVPMAMLVLPTALIGFLPAAIFGYFVAKHLKLRGHSKIGALGSICAVVTVLPFAIVIDSPAGMFFPLFAIVPGAMASLTYAKVASWDRTATTGANEIGTAHE